MSLRTTSFWDVIRTPEPPELGPGPRRHVLPLSVLAGRFEAWAATANLDATAAIHLRATAYLHHDHSDAAHDLVQDLPDPDGALIHGTLHRREPDYWNAKYWFRQAENHPVYRCMASRLLDQPAASAFPSLVERLTLTGNLDPLALVDAIEAVAHRPETDTEVNFLRTIQLIETECLVAHLLSGAALAR